MSKRSSSRVAASRRRRSSVSRVRSPHPSSEKGLTSDIAEYDALQRLHGWELVRFTGKSVQLRHLGQLDVSLQLADGVVDSATFELVPTEHATKLNADVTRFLFGKVVANIEWVLNESEGQSRTPRVRPSSPLANKRANKQNQSILNRIAALWTSSRRLRREISLVHLRFPTTARTYANAEVGQDVLRIEAEVHVPSQAATFVVVFELTGEELVSDEERRPAELEAVVPGVGCEVEVRFGSVE